MPSLPTRTTDIQAYQDEKIVCAKFQTYEADTPFKIKRVAFSNGDYQFQMVIKSNANATIKAVLGGEEKSILATPGFQVQKLSFPNLNLAGSSVLTLLFPVGTFWLYHLQLEAASSPSDWRPAPEDGTDYTDDATRESYDRAVSYADMTAEQKAEAAVEAQTQASIFNKLTDGGKTQGVYLQNGRVYINATYIQTGTLSIKKNNLETFYANADTGVVRIVADEFSLSGGETLASTLADSKAYADSQDASTLSSAKTYANSQDTINLASAKAYADTSSAAAVNAQTQAQIFNKLTDGGKIQGIMLTGGKIYINASYINAGVLSGNYIAGGILADATGNMSWNLETGALSAKRLSIDSTNFKLTADGALTATSGTLDYLTVKEHCNLAGVSSQVVSNARSDIVDIIANTVTANYITAKSAVLGKMSIESSGYVRVEGGLRATQTLYTNEVFANSYWTGAYQGTSSTIKINGKTLFSFNNGIYTGATVNLIDHPSAHVTLYFNSEGKCSPTWKSGYTASTVSVVYS